MLHSQIYSGKKLCAALLERLAMKSLAGATKSCISNKLVITYSAWSWALGWVLSVLSKHVSLAEHHMAAQLRLPFTHGAICNSPVTLSGQATYCRISKTFHNPLCFGAKDPPFPAMTSYIQSSRKQTVSLSCLPHSRFSLTARPGHFRSIALWRYEGTTVRQLCANVS